jgi:hypothetical protein
MLVELILDGESIAECDQIDIPRTGDDIVWKKTTYDVVRVTWNYDDRIVYLHLERIGS